MSYNKLVVSGNQIELYEYEKQTFNTGRPRGYKNNFNRDDLENGGADTLFKKKYARRKDNAQRASMAFRRLVLSNLTASENPLLVTLTFAENRTSISECAKLFRLFTQRMRTKYGRGFRYIAVPEFQQRGAVHYHALFWGLPSKVFNTERRARTLSRIWGEGFVFLKQTDGNVRLSSYLAKYMVKAILDPRLFYFKAYFASRNVKRPQVSKGFPDWWAEEEYQLSTLPPLQVKEFSTQWLGRGRYKLFNIIDQN